MISSKWPVNKPESLEDICLEHCIEHLETFTQQRENNLLELKPDISLHHPGLCDKLFAAISKRKHRNSLDWIGIFHDSSTSRLTHVNLSHRKDLKPSIHLSFLKCQPILSLSLSGCKLDSEVLPFINSTEKTLKILKIDEADSIFKELIDFTEPVLQCSNLQKLTLRCVSFHNLNRRPDLLFSLFGQLNYLTQLDLSDCQMDVEQMKWCQDLPNLLSLNISGIFIEDMLQALQYICKARKLRHLDVSSAEVPFYDKTKECLSYIVQNLSDLRSLDISGTNLAGVEVEEISHRLMPKGDGDKQQSMQHVGEGDVKRSMSCSIPGLEGASLDFLGLLDCPDDPCKRANIPAKMVTGSDTETQILLALRCYQDKKFALMSALNHLFNLFRYETVKDHCQSLEGILAGMEQNPDDKQIQISGSASLFYIVKGEQKDKIIPKQKRRLVQCLLDAMDTHDNDHTMLRNSCLTICNLNIPDDVMFCYRRLVKNLLHILLMKGQEEFILRISIYLLNSLACQVDGEEKKTFGILGAVNVMLDLIQRKLTLLVCDDVMEVAWSTLWNVTDETADNCDIFIEQDGLNLFRRCLEVFPEKNELLRNMMGLMGNIAEVKHLRRKLMNSQFIEIFSTLLESKSDGIEISYNAAGIFSHIAADGSEAWTISEPSREAIMERMIAAIQRWPLNSQRNINYRSFVPILKIVQAYDTVAAQYWAVWALCNLTSVYPEKYCELLKHEKGIEILQEVISDCRPIPAIKVLAQQVICTLESGHSALLEKNMEPLVQNADEDDMDSDSDDSQDFSDGDQEL